MTKRNKIWLAVFLLVDLVLILFSFWLIFGFSFHVPNFVVFQPKGTIARQELSLLVRATLIMLAIIVPVFIITTFIVWKYRTNNNPENYSPNLKSNFFIGTVLWLIPGVAIFTIATFIWTSSHELDPYKKIESQVKPITIQVVALNWKWLFIYPEQNIATVNFIEIPERTPINFELTADAPMNTFWIPQLAGQVYAMAGMENRLHVMADAPGEYFGSTTEINGKGYSGMRFKVKSVSETDFASWVQSIKSAYPKLTMLEYEKLAEDSVDNPFAYYASTEPDLYNTIIMKFMVPSNSETENMSGMKMSH